MTLAAIVVGVFAVVVILSAKAHSDRQRAARQAEALDAAIEAETACPMSLAVDDPTEEPMVPIVPGATLREESIEVPREGAVSPVHYQCADHWFDRRPSLVCAQCLPVLRERAVA